MTVQIQEVFSIPVDLKEAVRLVEINLELLYSILVDQILNPNFEYQDIVKRLNDFLRNSMHAQMTKKYTIQVKPSDRLKRMREAGLLYEEEFDKARSSYEKLDKIYLEELAAAGMEYHGKGTLDSEKE